MVSSAQLEIELATYIAGILGVSAPDEVHRGFVPEGADTGIGLMIVGREDTADYDVRQYVRTAIVSGKFANRSDAMDFIDTLESAFPVYGVVLGSSHCHSIEPDAGGGETPRQSTENGKRRWFASYALHVSAY